MQIYDLENNDLRNALSPCHLKLCECTINYILNCSICSTLSTYQVFFEVFNKLEIMRVISTRTGINGVSLAHHTSFARML